jgi:GntR family transcriptional regulator
MLIEIDHHIGVPIYRQIIRQVRQQIMTDGLGEGEKLEAVRDLAARLKVNPMTISKAYSFLEAEGLVERKRGVGLFVAKAEKEKKERIKDTLLNDAMDKAAMTAIQLGVSEEEAVEYLRKHYRTYDSKRRRGK